MITSNESVVQTNQYKDLNINMNVNKLNIFIPNNNYPERKYVVDFLFGELLQLSYIIIVKSEQKSSLVIEFQDRKVLFEDHFFNKHIEPKSYLSLNNLPQKITHLSSFLDIKIPIIYGTDTYSEENEQIKCGLDIIASSFFMLTRWEEYVLGRKENGKCNEEELLCVKCGYERIPIVHCYEDFLIFLLRRIGVKTNVNRSFEIKNTHDVDRCYLTGWWELFKNVTRIYKDGGKKRAWKILKDYTRYKIHYDNPFDTFSFYMNYADTIGVKDEFYFKCCDDKEPGKSYTIKDGIVQGFISLIKARGHIIGFHPSENTFENSLQFNTEIIRLKSVTELSTVSGRNHALLVAPNTYRDWDNVHADFVSNYGYQYRNGFRCGIAIPFRVFDIEQRTILDVNEIPFEIMDSVLLRTQPSFDDAFENIKEIIQIVKRHNGLLCINWHTDAYNVKQMEKYRPLYPKIIEYIGKQIKK